MRQHPTVGTRGSNPYQATRVLLGKETARAESVATTPAPHATVRAAHSRGARLCTRTRPPDGGHSADYATYSYPQQKMGERASTPLPGTPSS